MDIRSMLHDEGPAAAKPPAHPAPEQSLQQRSQSYGAHPLHDPSMRERPSSYGPPLQPPDPRSPQAGAGYFSHQAQSPYQNSATSAGTHSFNSQSPGAHSQLNTPRDTYPPHQQRYDSYPPQSPSVFAQPQTPGTQQYNRFSHPAPPYTNGPPPLTHTHSQSSREHSLPLTATPTSQSRHISPEAQFHPHPHPATPLGPPASFPKPLPQNSRPSLNHDHYRTYSTGSISSLTTREPTHNHMPSPEQVRRSSIHRQMSLDQERERSISVSPKTIPRPSPLRQPSGESHLQSQLTPPTTYPPENGASRSSPGTMLAAHTFQQTPPPSLGYAPSREQQTPSQPSSTRPSPSPGMAHATAPQLANTTPPSKPFPQPQSQEAPSLKRSASVISGGSLSSQPMRKKLKRDEIPIFARSARQKPLRFARGPGPNSYPIIKEERRKEPQLISNGHSQVEYTQAPMMVAAAPRDPTEGPWEPSVMNIIPYEDLTRSVCDWIIGTIGQAAPPSGGAVFEIEAKIGEIYSIDDAERINLPVDSETIFNKDKFRATKFESTMNVAQHKKINEFLNDLVGQTHKDPSREPLLYTHPHESDEFYELTQAGREQLPPSITQWIDRRRNKAPRVRITTDLKTNVKKAQIIKSRIADLEVYNPRCSFDFRISISIESPWEGQMDHLIPIGDGSNDRMKDRMSYRHGAYQIDLTQISYNGNKKPQQHELEVEISTELIRKELDNLMAKRPTRYEELVRGFIDNVRILCRTATLRPVR